MMHVQVGTGAVAPAPIAMTLRVTAIRWLAPAIREIELSAPDGLALPAPSPGAHVDLVLPGGLTRSYSLVNGPEDDRRYLLGVNRDPASRGGSAFVCEVLRVGDMLAVSGPLNNFPLAEATQSVFFAGGIGITPILSMIRALTARGSSWVLHYAVRNRAAAAYLPELQDLASAPGGRLEPHYDEVAGGVIDIAARVQGSSAEAHFYCCGPTPMITAFTCATAHLPPAQVHVEHFTNTFEAATTSFTVVLKRRGMELQVPPGRTILEVLLENGIRVAHSCQEGVCGSCETRLLEGIPDHKDKVLSDREKASGKVIMICCSAAKSDRLVLDI